MWFKPKKIALIFKVVLAERRAIFYKIETNVELGIVGETTQDARPYVAKLG